jgi:hypothetical protein
METDQIIKYIESPSSLGKKELIGLKELLNKYPYFQTAHLLFIKSAHNIKDVELEHYLVKSSTFINDRSILHALLAGKSEEYKTEIEKEPVGEISTEKTEISNQSETKIQDVKIVPLKEKTTLSDSVIKTEKSEISLKEEKQTTEKTEQKNTENKEEKTVTENSESIKESGSDNALKAHQNLINDFFKPKVELTKAEQKSNTLNSSVVEGKKESKPKTISNPEDKKKLTDDIFARIEALKNEKIPVKSEKKATVQKNNLKENPEIKQEAKSVEKTEETKIEIVVSVENIEEKIINTDLQEKVKEEKTEIIPENNQKTSEAALISDNIEIKPETKTDDNKTEQTAKEEKTNQFKDEIKDLIAEKLAAIKKNEQKINASEIKNEIVEETINEIPESNTKIEEEKKSEPISEINVKAEQKTEISLETQKEVVPEIKIEEEKKSEPISEINVKTEQKTEISLETQNADNEKSAAKSIYDKIAQFKSRKLSEKQTIQENKEIPENKESVSENTVSEKASIENQDKQTEVSDLKENISTNGLTEKLTAENEMTSAENLKLNVSESETQKRISTEIADDEKPLIGKITTENIEITEIKDENTEQKHENEDESEKNKKLIEKFIVTEPKLDAKKEPELQGDVSKASTVKKGEIVTELMANIYINQGFYDKAIVIFEKLILKYPKKKSYFASKIEELKKM